MKYRHHRGGLEDSLKTTIEVDNINDLKAYINESYAFGDNVEELKFEYIGMDDRINWDTYMVLMRLKDSDKFMVAGMSDGKL